MKKYILINVLMLWGCGSRTSQTEKSVQTNSELLKTAETAQNSLNTKTDIQEQAKAIKSEISQENKSISQQETKTSEGNSQKNNSEQNTKTIKKTTYYPNGQKKSETEMNESLSKISDEKDFYKTASEDLKKEVSEKQSEINSLEEQNKILSTQKDSLSKTNKTLLEEKKSKNLQTSKKTEREALPIWFWILVGFFIRILFGLFWKWFKTTSIFTKLPFIKFNNN